MNSSNPAKTPEIQVPTLLIQNDPDIPALLIGPYEFFLNSTWGWNCTILSSPVTQPLKPTSHWCSDTHRLAGIAKKIKHIQFFLKARSSRINFSFGGCFPISSGPFKKAEENTFPWNFQKYIFNWNFILVSPCRKLLSVRYLYVHD